MSLPDILSEHSQLLLDEWQQAASHYDFPAELQQQVEQVFACSEYVARLCIRKPEVLHELLSSGDLGQAYSAGMLMQRISAAPAIDDEAALLKYLRHVRQREMIRIIWRDITGMADLTQVMQELSELADACTELALAKLYQWQIERFGVPMNADGEPQQLVVIAMGKLGAGELNLSSDIDLIFAYPDDGETVDGKKQVSNAEFFQKLGQSLIAALSKKTEDGFVFRVDMRLRPFGESGPLVASFNAIEDYYQSHGREWERYAMIKARVMAGDQVRGQALMQMLKPFVYRRYVDYSAYESLREMKAMIQKEVLRKGKEQNIKVGLGGIREIEFIGQVFQLIQGGREPVLRERSILTILNSLQSLQLLPEFVVEQLLVAYAFLRRAEHRIQAWRDEQLHTLPTDELGQTRLAYAMGYATWQDFVTDLEKHRVHVHEHFEQVFAAPQNDDASEESLHVTPLWLGELEEDDAIARLVELGFSEGDGLWRRIKSIHTSHAYHRLSGRGRERMDRLMPLLIAACLSTEQPDLALMRSLQVIEEIMRRTVYLVLLIENPIALSQLVRLCASSPWLTHYLSRHPLLLDELLDPGSLFTPPDKATMAQELNQRMANLLDDDEQAMDVLRHFKHSHVFRVVAADISGDLPLMKVSDHLSWIAEIVLDKALVLGWQHLIAKHGRPVCTSQGAVCDTGFAVIAYGKLGGLELGYGSDLDLVFLHSGESEQLETQGEKPITLGVFFARLGQRIRHVLSAMTPAGVLYEVDMRLRPDGAAGMLVSSLAAFEAYQIEKAWIWEHQALVRARVVAGDPAIAERFETIRRHILGQQRDNAVLRQAVMEMRDKMRLAMDKTKPGEFDLKHSQGGIVDIEFMVQYGVLAFAHRHPNLLDWTDNIRLLAELANSGEMSEQDAQFLSETYRQYRNRSHRLKLQELSVVVAESEFAAQREGVQRIWSQWLAN